MLLTPQWQFAEKERDMLIKIGGCQGFQRIYGYLRDQHGFGTLFTDFADGRDLVDVIEAGELKGQGK